MKKTRSGPVSTKNRVTDEARPTNSLSLVDGEGSGVGRRREEGRSDVSARDRFATVVTRNLAELPQLPFSYCLRLCPRDSFHPASCLFCL